MSLPWIYAAWKNPRGTEIVILVMGALLAAAGALSLAAGHNIVGVLPLGIGVLCVGVILVSRRRAA